MTGELAQIDGYVFDLDGTVYVGDSLLPGAAAAIAELRRRDKAVLFVSNKPIEPREAYARKLTRLGIPAAPDDVITSAYVLARYLAQHAPDLRYYAIGEPNFLAELAGQGLTVTGELGDQDPAGSSTRTASTPWWSPLTARSTIASSIRPTKPCAAARATSPPTSTTPVPCPVATCRTPGPRSPPWNASLGACPN